MPRREPISELSPAAGRPHPIAPGERRPWVLAGFGLLLLHLGNPLTWGHPLPEWWFPSLGFGLVLVAWLGPRAVLLVVIDVLLVAVQAHLMGTQTIWGSGRLGLVGPIGEAVLLAAEILTAWGVYHQLARGARRLGDPRSATLFLLLVPGLVVGIFALPRGLLAWRLDPESTSLPRWIGFYWLSHALGILAVAPPLLAALTSWLVRHHLARPEIPVQAADIEERRPLTRSDVIEITVMAVVLAFLSLRQAVITTKPDEAGLQMWGMPLLVIVWASLRHGLRGGTIMASSAVCAPLLVMNFVNRPVDANPFLDFARSLDPHRVILQANLLAECSTALLAAAAANWIRLSEARYRQVVTRIPVVLYSARVTRRGDGRTPPRAEITFVSPAARTLFGVEPADLRGDYERWLVHVHPEDREILRAAVAQLERGAGPVTCEYRLTISDTGDGKYDDWDDSPNPARHAPYVTRWARDTLAPQYGPAGELDAWDGVISDITEQRALADDLRRTTSMFHALVANLPAGVFFVQGEAGLPILVNARARQLLGQREDPAAGVDRLVQVYRLCRPDGTPYPTEELPVAAALLRGATGMRDDIVVHRPDGRQLPLITWAAPIDLGGQGKHDAAVWVFEDLSPLHEADAARRESEAALQRAQRLDLIGRLASGIAHDFNNLLTVVLTLAELVRNTLPDDHPARDDLRRISYAGEQAANLAHQLLAFSKQRRPEPQRIDVNRVAGRTLELLRATLPKAIHIEPALAHEDLPVQADEMQLQQVLMNLCLNARDAMPNGGRLQVRTEAVDGGRGTGDGKGGNGSAPSPVPRTPSTAHWVRLSVQDNGQGIAEDVKERIFDPFFSTKERGTGLGLAMVRQIVEGFGGHVEVMSQPGEGARFDVWLPREIDGQADQASGNSGTGRRSGDAGSMPT
jgi:signal transduction histidine kinase/integral membrane sensor domain MASE1